MEEKADQGKSLGMPEEELSNFKWECQVWLHKPKKIKV